MKAPEGSALGVQPENEPSAAGGRYSEASEWQRSMMSSELHSRRQNRAPQQG